MGGGFKAPKGTYDLYGEQAEVAATVLDGARRLFEMSGFNRIETPAFEETGLFQRGVGGATDIVQKEMYTFEDRAGRSMTLRPEGTAPVCRAFIEHGMHKQALPVKFWYTGPMFRYESPQSGRFRQHYQFGVEIVGSASPLVDIELIRLQADLYQRLGLDLDLTLSSMGDRCCRPAYVERLGQYLTGFKERFTRAQLDRIEANPLRSFDWQEEGALEVTAAAPKLVESLCEKCEGHFRAVCNGLDSAGVSYKVEPRLVRGLDYYTRTVFEFSSSALGAQSGVGGGGRYDELIELLGGQPTAAAGWASGLERTVLALQATGDGEPGGGAITVFVALEDPGDDWLRDEAFDLVWRLRKAGISAEMDFADRSLKAQLKHANRRGARLTAGLGKGEGGKASVWLKDMASGEQVQSDLEGVQQLIASKIEVGQ